MLLSVNLARLPFSAFRGDFCRAGVVRCAATICLVWRFSAAFRGFPRLAFCSRRCGRFCFCRQWFSSVKVSGVLPSVTTLAEFRRLPSVMILSRLARFDRFRLALSAVRFCLVSAFLCPCGVSLAFDRFKDFRGVFGFPALPFIISPPPCCCQPIPQGLFLPYFALLLLLWCCMP